MRRYILALTWWPISLFYLAICLLALQTYTYSNYKPHNYLRLGQPVGNKFQFYAALPAVLGSENSSLLADDDRPYVLARFIQKYNPNSPLLPYTAYMVEEADRYNLRYELLTAVAMQESHLCERIPTNSRNCWGLGIYGTSVWRFDTYEEAIDEVSRTLSRYATHGKLQPEEIVQLYTPTGGGTWDRAIRTFINEMNR